MEKTLNEKVVEKLLNDCRPLNPNSPDLGTLQASAAIVTGAGFQHYDLSRDTRLTVEARKAHMFVSMNCEMMAKKILGFSGLSPEQVDTMLKAIVKQTADFRAQQIKKASEAPVSEKLKQ